MLFARRWQVEMREKRYTESSGLAHSLETKMEKAGTKMKIIIGLNMTWRMCGWESFEIRLLRDCPYCTLYMTANEIIWGIYTSDRWGVNSATLCLPLRDTELSSQLVAHFERQCAESKDIALVTFYLFRAQEIQNWHGTGQTIVLGIMSGRLSNIKIQRTG